MAKNSITGPPIFAAMALEPAALKEFLDEKFARYNSPDFIGSDPIQIPHRFDRKEDIEIAGFLAATLAWGQRPTIIRNANRLLALMDESPHDFVLNHQPHDLQRFEGFVHRTFNADDARWFMQALQHIYKHGGMELVFSDAADQRSAIAAFHKLFFSIPGAPNRTRKHVANPLKGSSAKRINMFLRWMVRNDRHGVDFGLWQSISPARLCLPLDVHTGNVARKLGLLSRKQNDWKAVEEVTAALRDLDSGDPVKYDFALFGLGVFEGF